MRKFPLYSSEILQLAPRAETCLCVSGAGESPAILCAGYFWLLARRSSEAAWWSLAVSPRAGHCNYSRENDNLHHILGIIF